jgi:hypothetical protein
MQLDEIVLLGRTFDEYYAMFDMKTLHGRRILDVASGVSSFCAEANACGYSVTASDRIYMLDADVIEDKCARDLDIVMRKVQERSDAYVWDVFKNVHGLNAQREKAYRTFIQDFRQYGQRYIPTEYPVSPFSDKQFEYALVSHFLLLYDDLLDYAFHKQTLLELLRIVSREVRIFPIMNLKGERSHYLEPLMNDADLAQFQFSIRKVNYEFIKNGNELLVISA